VTSNDLALLLHLVAVIGFFAGMTLAAAAQVAAWGRSRAGEIAAVLSLARAGVLLVGAGALLVLVSGLWLIEETGRSLGDGWIALSLALLAVAGVLGAIGGRKPKRARLLAEGQAADARPDPAIAALLRDPLSLTANALAAACAFAILVLMVWRPD
jgi:uncharacterized membrane protein